MFRGFLRTVRYARSWKNRSPVRLEETEIEREGCALPATLATPTSHRGGLPGWIVLGGVTRMGRHHPQLARFAHALAASGAGVIVPEIPEWRDLKLAPAVTVPTVHAAVGALDARPEVASGRYGLVGFSFGSPQAVTASGCEELSDRIGAVVSFGGYCDIERTLRCSLTGVHEWKGVVRRIEPDPYGRWVIGSNYLTHVSGCEDAADVAAALRRLALASTERRLPAWDTLHDELKKQLRESLPSSQWPLFDLFAPPAAVRVRQSDEGEAMALGLAGACRRVDPLLDPSPALDRICVPVHLFHGRADRLVPYTESLRLRERLPEGLTAEVTVTGLFAHSADHRPPHLHDRVREGALFFCALQRALASIG